MKFELSRLATNCSNEEIIAEIQRVDSLINKKWLTRRDFNQIAKIKYGAVVRRFGSWKKALTAAGIEHKSTERSEFKGMLRQKATNEQLVAEVQKIANQLGKEGITREEFRRYSTIKIAPDSVRRRFGSWANLMKAANLSMPEYYRRRYPDDEYFENLLKVWTHYGRQPSYGEIDQRPSTISSTTYKNHFGSWRKALEAFVARMNNDEAEPSDEAKPLEDVLPEKITEIKTPKMAPKSEELKRKIIKPEDRRGINLSLRYKVLSRDNFKCVRCGRSPAICLGIVLHVDHKDPFSKTGKTTLENLETKCSDCNIGKGNRHVE